MEFNPPQPLRVLQGFVHPPEPAHRPSYRPNHIVGSSLPSFPPPPLSEESCGEMDRQPSSALPRLRSQGAQGYCSPRYPNAPPQCRAGV